MYKKIETLHRLCEVLMEELEEYSKKIEKSDGMSAGDLEAVDKLTHALKSIKTTIAMMEAEEEDEYSNNYRGGMPWYGSISYEGNNMRGRSNRGGMSTARRGRANNPTGRNQYSRDGGYSYAEEFKDALEDALNSAPNEHVREKLQHIMNES